MIELDPWVTALLLLSGILYGSGVLRLWRRAGFGRGIHHWQVLCYSAGWLILASALCSPLHEISEHLFTAHMVEHELIIALAAPLLAVARPIGAFAWAMPAPVRLRLAILGRVRPMRVAWSKLTSPLTATVVHGAVIWLWHAPALFDLAVADESLHRLQHLSFLISALAFWWALLQRSERGAAVLHLFATMLHTTALGALIALAPRVLYMRQTADALHWGLTPLQDQQLAGLVMWVPAGTVYAGAALAFAALWVRRSALAWRSGDALWSP
jgi:cytochrome c oxidase assembly factor CtaG